ncbi:hypothetical protein [Litoreibacter albidus]|uniref:hypothetical protein n=1 Tax=Litoreibacter albidus TaxID=670155 RepID=UPI0037356894
MTFSGGDYDHVRYLPTLNKLFALHEPVRLDAYIFHPLIGVRIVEQKDLNRHTQAILNIMADFQADPTPAINHIRAELEQTLASYGDRKGEPVYDFFTEQRHIEGLHNATRALEQFSLTTENLRTLFNIAKIGGFYPGDAPAELVAMANIHTPNSSALTSLCQSFGFLKSIIPIYEEAADAGQSIVHLQVYGT